MVAATLALVGGMLVDASTLSARQGTVGSEVAAVRATMRRMYLALYAGPPQAICRLLTRADREAYARAAGGNCLVAARREEQANRHYFAFYGGAGKWRSDVQLRATRLRVRIVSRGVARVTDPHPTTMLPVLEPVTLVLQGHRWLFAGSAAAAGTGTPAGAASMRKDCGLISSRSWGGGWLTRNHVERVRVVRGAGCETAKVIARAFNHSPQVNQPRGWSCFNGHRPQPFLFDCGKGLRGQLYNQYFEVFPTYRLW
jgi:hypothetical protein